MPKGPKFAEITPEIDLDAFLPEEPGFLSKYGSLIIALLAIVLIFYVYKIMSEKNQPIDNFLTQQADLNVKFQESYNLMVDKFNQLSTIVHSGIVEDKIMETKISPSPSFNELSNINVNESQEVVSQEVEFKEPVKDDDSEISFSVKSNVETDKPKRGRKPKSQ
jgi:hypothetical protein